MSDITFGVIDSNCEQADRSFFTPHVALTTVSSTRSGQIIGFDEYIPSSPPKRYRMLTWAGSSAQQLLTTIGGTQVGGARFDYSGSSEIDLNGNYLSLYQKNLSAMCNSNTEACILLPGRDGGLLGYAFVGWLGPAGHEKCPPPGIPYSLFGNQAIGKGDPALMDFSRLWGSQGVGDGSTQVSNFQITSSTTASCVDSGSSQALICLFEPIPFDTQVDISGDNEGTFWFQGNIFWDHNYSATLSEEYTETDALNAGISYTGGGNTASNIRSGFVIAQTTVSYQLLCSNLVSGSSYVVSFDLADISAGTQSTTQIGFTATVTTKSISGSIPLPARGHSVVIRNPRIVMI